MKTIALFFILLFTSISIFSQGLSGTRIVGAGAYPTVNTAVDSLILYGVSGPTTFLILDGIYPEQLTIPPIAGASSVNTITFMPKNQDSTLVTIEWASPYTIRLDGADYIRFLWLTLKSNNGHAVEYTNGACNNIISNSIVTGYSTTSTSLNYALIYSGNSVDSSNVFKYSVINNGSYGFYYMGSTASLETNTIIKNCLFYNQGEHSIYIENQYAPLIRENVLNENYGYYSIWLQNCDYGYRILYNKTWGGGIVAHSCNGNDSIFNISANNFIRTDYGSGLINHYCSYVRNLYNTIKVIAGPNYIAAIYCGYGNTNMYYRNNILSNTTIGRALLVRSPMDSDHNVFYASATNMIESFISGTSQFYTSLSGWRMDTGNEINSIEVFPQYFGPTDFHLCQIDMDRVAVPVPDVLNDIDDEPRNTLFPDIGADEFTPVYPTGWPDDTLIDCITLDLDAGNPGASYLWSTGDTTQHIYTGTTGQYWVEITNSCGSLSDTIGVTIGNLLIVDLGYDTLICDAGSLTLDAGNPAGTFLWSTGATTQTLDVTTSGTYYVDVNDGLCSGSDTILVSFVTSPTADFTIGPSACTGNQLTATYTGSGSPAAVYSWTFGGGTATPGSGQGPQDIVWNTPGNYTVSLQVTENGCTSTLVSAPVTIYNTPTPVFSFSDTSICAGESIDITYTGNGTGGANYTWYFGTGTIISGSGQGPYNVLYTDPGAQTLTLTVEENGCTSAPGSIVLNVYPVPSGNFMVSNTQICSADSMLITYMGAASPGATYNWNFDGGTAVPGSGQGPHYVYWPVSGNYTVSLTVIENGCTSAPVQLPVSVVATPTSGFTVDPLIACTGDSVLITYTGSATPAATYNWEFPGSVTISGSGQGPYVQIYATPGMYTVGLQLTENGCISPNSEIPVTIIDQPTSTFTVSGDTICSGDILTVTYTGTAFPGSDFYWSFGNANILSGSGEGPYELSWDAGGINPLGLYVAMGGCSSDFESDTVTVFQTPSPGFTVTSPLCEGETGIANYTGNAGPSATFVWDVNGGTILPGTGAGPHQVSWGSYGTWYVNMTVVDSGCAADSTILVVVNPNPPVPVISQSGDSLFSSSATGNQWYLNGSPISGANNANYLATQSGVYQVEVTNVYGCTAMSDTMTVIVSVLEDYNAENYFNIFPNPGKDEFTLDFISGEPGTAIITIFDITGKEVYSAETVVNEGRNKSYIHFNEPAGVYHIKLFTLKQNFCRKLIVR